MRMTDPKCFDLSASDPCASTISPAPATGGAAIRLIVVAALLVLGTGLMEAPAAQAQFSEEPSLEKEPFLEKTQERRSDLERLPSWAEPSPPERGRPSIAPERPRGGPSGPGSVATNDFNPGEPGSVPLGGLEWLLAAGAGYAVWKLGLTGEEDEGALS